MSKPRSDSKLLNLPEEKIAQISDWLLSGMPYHQVKKMIAEQYQLSISLAALSNFYQSVCAQELIARRQRAVSTADEIAAAAQTKPGNFDSATIDALKQKAFELSINPGADPRDVKSLFMLVLKARDQQISEKQLALDREKFEFDAAKAALAKLPDLKLIASDKSLSDDDKLTAIREKLFGEVPA